MSFFPVSSINLWKKRKCMKRLFYLSPCVQVNQFKIPFFTQSHTEGHYKKGHSQTILFQHFILAQWEENWDHLKANTVSMIFHSPLDALQSEHNLLCENSPGYLIMSKWLNLLSVLLQHKFLSFHHYYMNQYLFICDTKIRPFIGKTWTFKSLHPLAFNALCCRLED